MLLAAALLGGCADDSTRLAGGTGSDLPRPVARLMDSTLQPVDAMLYRLWKVQGDSLVPTSQVAAKSFALPEEGAWVVEAWSDTEKVGSIRGLASTSLPDTSCDKAVAEWINAESSVGIAVCNDLIDTSNHRRPLSMVRSNTPRPKAAGIFRVNDPVRRFLAVPDGVKAFRFLFWSIQWGVPKRPDTSLNVTTHEVDSVLIAFRDWQVSPRAGVAEVTLPKGDWLIEGWTASLTDSGMIEWATQQPIAKYADSALLRACADAGVGVDCGRPTRANWVDKKAPDKIFFYRAP